MAWSRHSVCQMRADAAHGHNCKLAATALTSGTNLHAVERMPIVSAIALAISIGRPTPCTFLNFR